MADVQTKVEEIIALIGTRDLTSYTADLKANTTWKNSGRPWVMAQYADMYAILASLADNGVLPAKKTSLGLAAVHHRMPINFSARPLSDWCEDLSCLIRAGFSKYRELKTDPEALRRCIGKASMLRYLGSFCDNFELGWWEHMCG